MPQELNDRRLTLYEGSALSERDLVRTRAESASAVLLLADRFSPSVHHEDLSIQFQAWARSRIWLSLHPAGETGAAFASKHTLPRHEYAEFQAASLPEMWMVLTCAAYSLTAHHCALQF